MPEQILVTGAFDNPRSPSIRFLEEASKQGELSVLLWSDGAVEALGGKPQKFPEAERRYLVDSIRYVGRTILSEATSESSLGSEIERIRPDLMVFDGADSPFLEDWRKITRTPTRVLSANEFGDFPASGEDVIAPTSRKKIVVTGCYDWFHSGHVRFFEEVNEHGDVYVVVGHDRNVRELKGEGHPMFSQDERRYITASIRYVKQAFISTGEGWLDAEPEIERIQPDAYAVNEDGDRPVKREFCEKHGIDYLVLKRTPRPGLPRRSSTDLRGF